ncbi:MAG: gamma-glutamylcyclotransferase family protein [candidate division KSB1 bacterium]|nr:gamma-glutamylcyclotransferase family protein [candidate division KSB1 bacterium]
MSDSPQQRGNTAEAIDKLFVYGSLNSDYHLQLLTGRHFESEPAVLLNHRRIQPEKSFPFALPWRGYTIKGRLLYNITPEIIEILDEYENEGSLYERRIGTVRVDDHEIRAFIYIGIVKAIKPYMKRGFQERDRVEEFVEKNVDRYLKNKADYLLSYDRESLSVKVTRELLSEEVHSLIRQYFHDYGLPWFIIKHEIEKASIPRLDWLRREPEAQPYADRYMSLSVFFMIFSRLEERFRNDYRFYVKVTDAYFLHTMSTLMALKLIIDNHQAIQAAIMQLGIDHWETNMVYTDYAVGAIFITEELYSREKGDHILEWIRQNRHIGLTPLGAELEFSNLGHRAIGASSGQDSTFDAFYYFYDFDLMRRGWKLGAHVDDHGFLTSTHTRTRGFLELAFGRYKLLGDVSKPATQDPWVLSQIIDLAVRFLDIRPHSVHLTFGAPDTEHFKRVEKLEYYLCLLILGGDLREDAQGNLREMRIYRNEIMSREGNMLFSRLNKHHKNPEERKWSFVVEYQFPRLFYEYDYQPLIMALKGFQQELNPYPFQGCREIENDPGIQSLQEQLKIWAASPTPLSDSEINEFVAVVEKGLTAESEKVDTSYENYAMRIIGRIEERLNRRNKRIKKYHESKN